MPNDTAICSEDVPLTITSIPNNHTTLNWSTGDLTESIDINVGGEYTVTVTDGLGCSDMDTINVEIEEMPDFELGNDTNLCVGEEITIGINNTEGWSLNWNDGEVSETRLETTDGLFELTASTNLGCIGKDTIVISFQSTKLKLVSVLWSDTSTNDPEIGQSFCKPAIFFTSTLQEP